MTNIQKILEIGLEEYLEKSYKEELFRGASTGGAAKFIITEMLKVNLFDNSSFACLQIPTEYEIKWIEIELDKKLQAIKYMWIHLYKY